MAEWTLKHAKNSGMKAMKIDLVYQDASFITCAASSGKKQSMAKKRYRAHM